MKCPACGSDDISPEYKAHRHRDWAFGLKIPGTSIFSISFANKRTVEKGRICLSCGYVFLFMESEAIQRIKENLGKND